MPITDRLANSCSRMLRVRNALTARMRARLRPKASIRDVRLHMSEAFDKDVPAKLRRILLASLSREPSERPPDARSMRADLLDFAQRR